MECLKSVLNAVGSVMFEYCCFKSNRTVVRRGFNLKCPGMSLANMVRSPVRTVSLVRFVPLQVQEERTKVAYKNSVEVYVDEKSFILRNGAFG